MEFVVLKGLTHEAGFGLDLCARVQYDIDLLSPKAGEVRRVLRELGFRPHGAESLSDEHERPMVRPSNWTWRGDYFDPQMPIPVEVHWTPLESAARIVSTCRVWRSSGARRQTMDVAGAVVPAYSEPDRVAFAAMHVLRHVLRNDARPAHVYELARFLRTRRFDTAFWASWQSVQSDDVKTSAAVGFRFAQAWFGCALPGAVGEDAALLPALVTAWFNEFAWSPVVNLIEPNKDVCVAAPGSGEGNEGPPGRNAFAPERRCGFPIKVKRRTPNLALQDRGSYGNARVTMRPDPRWPSSAARVGGCAGPLPRRLRSPEIGTSQACSVRARKQTRAPRSRSVVRAEPWRPGLLALDSPECGPSLAAR